MTSSPASPASPARPTRLRRVASIVGASALCLPLAVVSVAAPAEAAVRHHRPPVVRTVDYGFPGYGSYDYSAYGGYSGYGGYDYWGYDQPHGYLGDGVDPYGSSYGSYGSYTSTPTTTSSTTSDATTAESVGLVDVTSTLSDGVAAGTGMVIDSDGVVVTNHHVIAGATSVVVTVVATGQSYRATVVGSDTGHDVAVLQLADASGLATVTTGGDVTKGETVTAVGDANGDGGSLTAAPGEVTKRRTSITVTDDAGGTSRLRQVIEVSSDIIPGDSGGALLDADGDAVGMNVAASESSNPFDTDTTGYVIPVARVLRIADRLQAQAAS